MHTHTHTHTLEVHQQGYIDTSQIILIDLYFQTMINFIKFPINVTFYYFVFFINACCQNQITAVFQPVINCWVVSVCLSANLVDGLLCWILSSSIIFFAHIPVPIYQRVLYMDGEVRRGCSNTMLCVTMNEAVW